MVVYLPLWKIWKSVGIIILNIWMIYRWFPTFMDDFPLSSGKLI